MWDVQKGGPCLLVFSTHRRLGGIQKLRQTRSIEKVTQLCHEDFELRDKRLTVLPRIGYKAEGAVQANAVADEVKAGEQIVAGRAGGQVMAPFRAASPHDWNVGQYISSQTVGSRTGCVQQAKCAERKSMQNESRGFMPAG